MLSRSLWRGVPHRSPRIGRRRTLIERARHDVDYRERNNMKLNVLKPSVNNMAVRVFVRAANLEFTEDDVYGKTRTTEFLAKNPAHMTPMIETKDFAEGRHMGKLRHHAVSL